jgi:RNA polymerase sigma factor (sigma-70 family)
MKSITLMPGAAPVSSPEFDHFYRTHRTDAVRWAIALLGDRDVAEELAQDAFAAMSRRLDRIDNPVGYLRRTVVNRAASWHRSHAREQRRIHRAVAGQPSTYSAETHEMLGVLASLPHKQRAAVALRYRADWTDEQIAEALGCAPSTVRVLVHRALATLKQEIAR